MGKFGKATGITDYKPTFRDKARWWLGDAMGGGPFARRTAERFTGTPDTVGLLDFTAAGVPMGVQEGARTAKAGYQGGDPAMMAGGAARAGLSMLPLVAGGAALRAAGKAAKDVPFSMPMSSMDRMARVKQVATEGKYRGLVEPTPREQAIQNIMSFSDKIADQVPPAQRLDTLMPTLKADPVTAPLVSDPVFVENLSKYLQKTDFKTGKMGAEGRKAWLDMMRRSREIMPDTMQEAPKIAKQPGPFVNAASGAMNAGLVGGGIAAMMGGRK